MSIASEIARLQGVKSDILQAISDKGVDVPSGSKLDDCPTLIASITGGGGGGGECVEIGGDVYGVATIGNKKYITENLRYWGPGIKYAWPPHNSSPIGRPYFEASSYDSILYIEKFGIYYNEKAKDWILSNLDLKGFRFVEQEDLDEAKSIVGVSAMKSTTLWASAGTNESKLNLYPTGWIEGNSYNELLTMGRMWKGTSANILGINDAGTTSYYPSYIGEVKLAPIRLCKDA